MSLPSSSTVGATEGGGLLRETSVAVKNALILTLSLAGTWAVAVVIRLWLPRLLGPTVFGQLHFAEYFTITFFVLTNLGLDNYIRKEVPTRPAHASEFFGGTLLLRTAVSGLLLGAMAWVLTATGRDADTQRLVYLFAGAYFLVSISNSLAALLQAVGEVKGYARVNVAAKLLWGTIIGGGLLLGLPIVVVPVALLSAEALKAVVLFGLARKHLGLRLSFQLGGTLPVLLASLPFFVNSLARTLYDKIDVSMIALMTGNREAGLYGAATSLTGVTLVMIPLVIAVVLPTSSRARALSDEDLQRFMDGSLRVTLTGAVPVALLFFLGADFLVRTVFGPDYVPAAGALQILAVTFIFTYVATVTSVHLFQLGKVWLVTGISFVALLFNPLLNWFTIPAASARLGIGGAGTGAAWASLASEALVVLLMHVASGERSALRTLVPMLLRSAAAVAGVVVLHLLLAPIGPWRLAVDAVAYLGLAFAFGAVSMRDVRSFLALLRTRRSKT